MIKLWFPILFVLTLFSCNNSEVFIEKMDFDSGEWSVKEAPEFSFNIEDTSATYKLIYLIRNEDSYPYYNLYLTYFLKDSAGNLITKQLQEIHLMDPKTGKPFGKGFGSIRDHEVISISGLSFSAKGPYYFKVKHYMRVDNLPGIMSFGLKVEKED